MTGFGRIDEFRLERYFARLEFRVRHTLSASDCQPVRQSELLSLASPELRERWDQLELGYTESAGLPELRAEIAGMYRDVQPDDVLIGAPEELIFLLMHALLRAGDHVVCPFPAYQSLYEVAASIGCRVSHWQPDESGGWTFSPQSLEALLLPTTRLVVLNFPHNPTGFLPAASDFAACLSAARACGAYVLSDEMYRLLELAPSDLLPAACETDSSAFTLAGMSKVFGLAGLRIGWLILRDPVVRAAVARLKDYTSICSSAPSELLTLIGLRARDYLLERNRTLMKKNLTVLVEYARTHSEDIMVIPPRAGTICLPRLTTGEPASALAERAAEAGLLVLPSAVYGYGDSHFRIGLGREDFPEALEHLETIGLRP